MNTVYKTEFHELFTTNEGLTNLTPFGLLVANCVLE